MSCREPLWARGARPYIISFMITFQFLLEIPFIACGIWSPVIIDHRPWESAWNNDTIRRDTYCLYVSSRRMLLPVLHSSCRYGEIVSGKVFQWQLHTPCRQSWVDWDNRARLTYNPSVVFFWPVIMQQHLGVLPLIPSPQSHRCCPKVWASKLVPKRNQSLPYSSFQKFFWSKSSLSNILPNSLFSICLLDFLSIS